MFLKIGMKIILVVVLLVSLSSPKGPCALKVMTYNVWGLPFPISQDKGARMIALRDELLTGDYDIVVLQELWFASDYDLLKKTMPYVTRYTKLNSGCCLGLLIGCSGLAILSRFPIVDVGFFPFKDKGHFFKFDGEASAGKGLAIARILFQGKTIDIATTHLIHGPYSEGYNLMVEPADENKSIRYLQAKEIVSTLSHLSSDADILIFGGDVNAHPRKDLDRPYMMLRALMRDTLIEVFGTWSSLQPEFATYANPRNTYTKQYVPERLDYLMYRTIKSISMSTVEFKMPNLQTRTSDNRAISLSDHEPLVATFLIQDHRK